MAAAVFFAALAAAFDTVSVSDFVADLLEVGVLVIGTSFLDDFVVFLPAFAAFLAVSFAAAAFFTAEVGVVLAAADVPAAFLAADFTANSLFVFAAAFLAVAFLAAPLVVVDFLAEAVVPEPFVAVALVALLFFTAVLLAMAFFATDLVAVACVAAALLAPAFFAAFPATADLAGFDAAATGSGAGLFTFAS